MKQNSPLIIRPCVCTLFLICMSFLFSERAFAQITPRTDTTRIAKPGSTKQPASKSVKDRIFMGGSLGLNFGDITYIQVAPLIGYRITERLQGGVGLNYQYFHDKRYNFKTSNYGGNIFGRMFLVQNLFAQAEYHLLNVETFSMFNKRVTIDALMVGGGYRQPMGRNASFVLSALWKVAGDARFPIQNPVINAGVNLGF